MYYLRKSLSIIEIITLVLIIVMIPIEPAKAQSTSLVEIATIGHGTAEVVDWHPDGSMLAIGGTYGLWLYTDNFQIISHIPIGSEHGSVRWIEWSPDGSLIAAGLDELQIWDTSNLSLSASIPMFSDDPIQPFAWNSDSTKVVTIQDKNVVISNAQTGQELIEIITGHSVLQYVTWSPDSNYIATGGLGEMPRIWDASTGSSVVTINRDAVHIAVWSPDSSTIALSHIDSIDIEIWDVASNQLVTTLTGHNGRIARLWWGEQKLISISGNDNEVRIWDVPSAQSVVLPVKSAFHYQYWMEA